MGAGRIFSFVLLSAISVIVLYSSMSNMPSSSVQHELHKELAESLNLEVASTRKDIGAARGDIKALLLASDQLTRKVEQRDLQDVVNREKLTHVYEEITQLKDLVREKNNGLVQVLQELGQLRASVSTPAKIEPSDFPAKIQVSESQEQRPSPKDACGEWHQTGGCLPNGPEEPQFNKDCNAEIGPIASGWCVCPSKRVPFRCEEGRTTFRCRDFCLSADRPNCEGGSAVSVSCPVPPSVAKRDALSEMCVHLDGESISDRIRLYQSWDPELCFKMVAYSAFSSPKRWFVDAGSNIGFVSVCAFHAHIPVLSIEATPWNFGRLNQTRTHYLSSFPLQPWKAVNIALSNVRGENLSFIGNSANLGGSTAVKPGNHPLNKDGWGEDSDHTAVVMSETLDNVISSEIPKDDCIISLKIDIEGFEYFAFQGATEWLKTRPPCHIFMEYHTMLLKAASSSDENDTSHLKLVKLLRDAGYTTSSDMDVISADNVHWVLSNPPATQHKSCQC